MGFCPIRYRHRVMNDERIQAYLNLIQALLSCPNGEEPQILQANSELLDLGFVLTCEAVAAGLAEEGKQNEADFLRSIASQVGEFLRMNDGEDSDNSEGENPSKYLEFIYELLRAEESYSDIAVVYSILDRGKHLLNDRFAEILQQVAANLIAEHPDATSDIAAIIENLSIHINLFPRGKRASNIEIAIAGYQIVLNHWERGSEKWAQTQNNLAAAYYSRIIGDRAQNIEKAIEFYTAALTVRTREAFPEKWAMTQNNLAAAYYSRIIGDRTQNIEKAIAFFKDALEVRTRTRDAFPERWAETQNNLGEAYRHRRNGEKADNIEQAIAFYNAALEVYTSDNFRERWAETQNNLGEAYRERIRGDQAENIEQAIVFYNAALKVHTREAFPEYWATAKNNLAISYCQRIRGKKPDNIKMAIELYRNALNVTTREAFPQEHTETLSNLGILYQSNQQWQLAYDTFSPAIETVEFLRGEIQSGDEIKQKLAEEWNNLYLRMVEVCIQMQRYTEAVEYAERSKAQNLIELLSVKDLYPKGEIPPQVRQELQQLRLRIAQENQRLKQAESKNYDFINQLRQDLAAKYPYTPLNFGEIKQLAAEKTAILEWYILGSSFCSFIITKDNPQPKILSFPEPDLDLLIDWVNEYLGDYYSNPQQWQNSLETKLANLAQILHIDEILKSIPKTCDKLIQIPHRYLHLFPLHALPVSRENWQRFHSDNSNCPPNPYLIDCFDKGVSYTPSCQILHQVQKYQRGKFDKLFAIQNPENNLMAADMEVESIKNIFPNPVILAKQNAKKGKQLEEKLEIAEQVADSHHLFFSCHGSFNPNEPLKSGLQLADGTLTLEEIIRYFNLSECSLVTLSACETGQVRLDNTDEYISLTSGFLLAGSPSLYVTLWSVNAFSTAILLIKTYENLYQQPGKLALALNQAQIWVRDTDIQGFLDWTNECHLLDDTWRQTLQDCLEDEKATQGANAKIYQNPYHWAGFCAAGKGEQNMSNSITKIELFQQLIQESDLFFNLRNDLVSLKEKLTEDDEENIKIIENWLKDKPEIRQKYNAKLMNSGVKLGRDGISSTKPGQKSKSLIETIENLTVAPEKTSKKDPKSSP